MSTHITDRERGLNAANSDLLNAIERLELEAVAATLLIENNALEFVRIYGVLKSHAEITQKAEAERDALRAELAALKNQPHIARATGKNSGDYSEVARVYETPLPAGVALYLAPGAQPVPDYDALEREHLGDAVKGTGIYAQPVPDGCKYPTCHNADYQDELCKDLISGRIAVPAGMVLVPIVPTEAMLNAELGLRPWDKLPSYESRRDLRPHIYKAMLEAAKDKP